MDNIWLAFRATLPFARLFADLGAQSGFLPPGVFNRPVDLRVDSARVVNAFAHPDGSAIQINLALAELIFDSPSELAFVVAHEPGHVFQRRTGLQVFDSLNPELDADIWGFSISLLAGNGPHTGVWKRRASDNLMYHQGRKETGHHIA